jgi:UTP:GlnB (protein PII) uridylyltransferase
LLPPTSLEVIEDLCDVVADLFVAESKLLKPAKYGIFGRGSQTIEPQGLMNVKQELESRSQVVFAVKSFVSSLPLRYALTVDTPSEVLLHMRLMAVPRCEPAKAAIHIHSLDDDPSWQERFKVEPFSATRSLRQVTISCDDRFGLLEFITAQLSRQKSRVLDADVMLSSDGIVLVSESVLHA